LRRRSEITEDILATSVVSKLGLLLIHFPRLRVVWSRSLHATAEIFALLKMHRDEPDTAEAAAVGVPQDREEDPSLFNETAVDMLKKLPGITDKNYRSVLKRCSQLADLGDMPLEEMQAMLGDSRQGKSLFEFLHAQCPTVAPK